MEPNLPKDHITLRQATQADSRTIRRIISQVRINPLALDWRRFILAVDNDGGVIGCGQIKPHSDGSFELSSIAVLPDWRGKGVARQLIDALIEQHPGTLYLTCQSHLGPLYQKFGFQVIHVNEMTPYFRRLSRLVAQIGRLTHQHERMLVMRRL